MIQNLILIRNLFRRLFILYFFMGLLLLVVAGLLFFRWRVCKMRREMEERFGREFGPERPGGFR